jgi:hypothetical protein
MKTRVLLALALAALAFGTVAATAVGGGKAQLFLFDGTLLNASSGSVSLQVDGGNRPALRALLGQSANQSFTLGPQTQILVWSKGVPHVGSITDLAAGDDITLRVRAPRGSSLAQIEATPAANVADRNPNRNPPRKPLWLFQGTVTGPQSGGHIALHVMSGNWRALHAMLGQSLDQTFAYGDSTIFLLWQGKVPTVIDASQLKAGDRITIRVRAPKASTLAQVAATPANHVGDHEPANPETAS